MFVGVLAALLFFVPECNSHSEDPHRDAGASLVAAQPPDGRSSARPAHTARTAPQLPEQGEYVAEHDHESDRYDPSRFAMSVGDIDVPWMLEPRIESWATPREASINRWLAEHMAKASQHAELKSVACRKRMCKVEVAIPREHVNDLTDRYPIFMLAPSTTISSGADGTVLFYLSYPSSLLDETKFNEYLERALTKLRNEAKGGVR